MKPSITVDGKKQTASTTVTGFQSTQKPGKHQLQSSAKTEPATVDPNMGGENDITWQMVI